MLRKDAKVELLRAVPLFERCSKSELRSLAGIADEISLPAGRALTKEDSVGHEFVIVVDGSAEVTRGRRTLNHLGAGDFLGEIALVTGRPRTATVTTLTTSRLLVINEPDFRRLLRDSPAIQTKILAAVAERLEGDD